MASRFRADRARAALGRLCSDSFAGRRVGSAGHDRARDWLAEALAEAGARVELRLFSAEADVLDLVEQPVVLVDHARALAHRTEVAEHPASASFDRVAGRVAPPRGDVGGAWVALEEVGDLEAHAVQLAERRAAGILAPQRPFDGYLAKRIVARRPLALPVLSVEAGLLPTLVGRRLTASLRVRRLRVAGTHVLGHFGANGSAPLLLSAHYDGVGDDPALRLPGAADNASGAAVVLEVARALAAEVRHGGRSLVVAFVDGEEANALGSRALAAELAEQRLRPLVLNLDLAARLASPVAVEASADARPLLEALDAAGRAFGVPLEIAPVASDNRRFAGAGFPSVGVGLGAHAYHTPADVPERVETAALATAGELVLAAARHLTRKELP